MKNIVCVKEVPDPQDMVLENGNIQFDDPLKIVNPYDEYAVEEAVSLRERFGYSSLAITAGEENMQVVQTAVALGIEAVMEVSTKGLSDARSLGEVIAKVIKTVILDEESIGLIIVGRQSIDQAKGQVGCVIAETLNIPYISNVIEIVSLNKQSTRVKRKDNNGYQTIQTTVPCVVQVSGGEINEPRLPTVKGLFKAKKYTPQKVEASTLNEDANKKSPVNGNVQHVKFELPPERQQGKLLKGEPQDLVNEVVKHVLPILNK